MLSSGGWLMAWMGLRVRLEGSVRSILGGFPGVLEIEKVRGGCSGGKILVQVGIISWGFRR